SYFYALRNQGTFKGSLTDDLDACVPLEIKNPQPTVYLGWQMSHLKPFLEQHYSVIDLTSDYKKEVQITNLNGIFGGELAGALIPEAKLIDGAALAFVAREAGFLVTTLNGSDIPPIYTCQDYCLPELIIATSPAIHQNLLEAVAYCESHF
ncbi:MAG: inositol monophosphatase family protein, partial [Moorea sp. SIO2B7]|nr:inositol monophosphatase family protein [Moorena sp. SIO2B7]